MIFVVKLFSLIASKVPRQKLISWVTLFFISNLFLFYLLHGFGLSGKAMGITYFIWVGIFNVLAVAQFWAFANDIYIEEVGRRLFPIIAFGAVTGGWVGSELTKRLAESRTVYEMMLVAAGILGIFILFTYIIHKREIGLKKKEIAAAPVTGKEEIKIEQEKPLGTGGGFRILSKNRYLLCIAFFVLLLNFINQNGQLILDKVSSAAEKKEEQIKISQGVIVDDEESRDQFKVQFYAKFYAGFNAVMNLWAMFLQLFIVSRIFKWFGVRIAVFFLPVIALGGYAAIGLAGASLLLTKWVKAFENGTDYSMMNTTRHALFLITSRQEKYKAKAAVDTFFHRTGDSLSALFAFLNITFLNLAVHSIARLNVIFIIIWIVVGAMIFKLHKKLSASRPEFQRG
jgi:AAA family ATP:ADP antiporter